MCLIWCSLIILLSLVNVFMFYISLIFLFYKLIHQPLCLYCIKQNYDYKHAFLWILNFYTFIYSFLSCFLHICSAWAMSSIITSSISISAGQNRLRSVWWEPKKNELQRLEWKVVALVTHHECSQVGSHSLALLCAHHPQVCHDHGRYFGQWNLSRGDMSIPNGSIIFCPASWKADVMTGAGAAMLDQR